MQDAGGSFASLKPCPSRSAPPSRVALRAAREADLPRIAAIWNHEVLSSDSTTDTEPRDPAAQREWFARHTERYPVVVATVAAAPAAAAPVAADGPECDGEVVAYGSLSPYRPKPAFARTVEDSVYVACNYRGAGLGGLILAELVRRARALEHHSIVARITARNAASLRTAPSTTVKSSPMDRCHRTGPSRPSRARSRTPSTSPAITAAPASAD